MSCHDDPSFVAQPRAPYWLRPRPCPLPWPRIMTPSAGSERRESARTAVLGTDEISDVSSDTNISNMPTRRCGLVGVAMRYHARWSRPPHGGGLSRLALVLQRPLKLMPFREGQACWGIDSEIQIQKSWRRREATPT